MKIDSGVAMVLASLFGMLGGLGSAYITRPATPETVRTTSAKPASTPVTAPGTEGWVEKGYGVNVAYAAETDGFVAALTGGNKPAAGADVFSGPTAKDLTLRTRAGGSYAGAVLPVRKGEYWLVKPQGSGTVTVQWLSTPRLYDARPGHDSTGDERKSTK
ncbi:hypothetical protein [Tahibacter amnicola]|uniref:Uncharacterized protein n=1 Tax=Tahibacter amnicola TaxID=2976241 RepID=A0ABY6BBK5_9GAMM|nr:hypothetical protein [Tahibacter amnicola]UXI67433.1 hypothetical protein N4264_22280 [Tahibacter amnicola]